MAHASSSHHGSEPAYSNYYELCKNLANNLTADFKVYKVMTSIAWAPPEDVDPHVSATLYVQARNRRASAPDGWEVKVQNNENLIHTVQRLIRRGPHEGPQDSIVYTDDESGLEALFKFKKTGRDRPDKPAGDEFIAEPEPANVMIRGPETPLENLADFLLRVDRLFDIWEGHKSDRNFVLVEKMPRAALMLHETYWMFKDGHRTSRVNIALYASMWAKTGRAFPIPINKGLIEKLIKVAEDGVGEPGLHYKDAVFIWQLTEGVKTSFEPPDFQNFGSDSSSSSSSGSSPAPGPSHPGPSSSSQKRTHPGSGSGSTSKRSRFGSPSGSGPHTQNSSQPSSQHGPRNQLRKEFRPNASDSRSESQALSGMFNKNMKI